jgi:hypothetical protein
LLSAPDRGQAKQDTAFAVLAAISFSHLLNDTIQSVLPAIYPLLKSSFALTFAQVGLMGMTQQITASLLQPAVGLYTDRRPMPFALASAWRLRSSASVVVDGRQLRDAAAARGADGHRIGDVSPESSRVARWPRAGATAWRSRSSRSAATSARRSGRCSGLPDRPARPAEHRVVLAAGADRDRDPVARRSMAQGRPSEAPRASTATPAASRVRRRAASPRRSRSSRR